MKFRTVFPFLVLALSSCKLTDLPFFSTHSSNTNEEEKSSLSSSSEESQEITSEEEKSSAMEESSIASSESTELQTSQQASSIPDPVSEKTLFDLTASLSISMAFEPDALRFISDYQSQRGNYLSDAYVPANLTIVFDGDTYVFEDVGVRMKGNTSRRPIYWGDDIENPVHFKVNFKATFDDELYEEAPLQQFAHTWEDNAARKARKKRNFLGYEKLDLKYIPRNSGNCSIQEIYAYDAFEKAGIMAPKARTASVTISDGASSIFYDYEVVECIDKDFITRRLGKAENSGDLYKCVYNGMGKADFARDGAVEKNGGGDTPNTGARLANGKIGVEDNYHGYVPCYQLKTNDDLGEDSDFSKMADLINAFWSVRWANGSQEMLESKLDIDHFLKFSAISYLLGNADDQRYNFNNFYLYFLPSNGKAYFIPYDWDWCFGTLGNNMAQRGPLDEYTLDGSDLSNPFRITFLSNGGLSYDANGYQQTYLNYVNQFKDMVYDTQAFDDLVALTLDNPMEYGAATSFFQQRLELL